MSYMLRYRSLEELSLKMLELDTNAYLAMKMNRIQTDITDTCIDSFSFLDN
jgi:hypothetical protein